MQNIKKQLEDLDKQINNEKWRLKNGYIRNTLVPRTILTQEGPVTFQRTKYKYIGEDGRWHYKYLLDNYIQLNKWQRLSLDFIIAILEHITSKKTYKNILSVFPNMEISERTISNIVKKYNIKELINESFNLQYKIPDISKYKYIYILTDDTWEDLLVNKQSNECRYRLVTFHIGKDARGRLLNKRQFYWSVPKGAKINTKKFVREVARQLLKFYGATYKEKELFLCGDGAGWIKITAQELKSNYVLDYFHLSQYIHKAFNKKRHLHPNYRNLFDILTTKIKTEILNGDVAKVITFLSDFKKITEYSDEFKIDSEHYNKLIRYLKNQQKGIESYRHKGYIGSCSEAMISHSIKAYMGYGAKIYKYESFNVILDLAMAKTNGLDPLKVLKDNIIAYHEQEIKYYRQNIWKWYKHWKKDY
ncbi:MAG: hypothetical protein EIB84_03410 [Spiroplasma poulsonii]|uniref:ISLre2 family transposase n=2 Tax=Spiroplasma poulsonii TaxID=2138 RepID=A0A2P6FF97_9MOLU|nr:MULTISPECIES: UPF0236 family protein [Spiroplasma]KAF0850237.1 hypothetical protein MSROBK_020520 [Spiroplasma poulsonii]MBH8623417.1 hypothetical protein [Spiroplasma sp. hyd1]MBW1241909.1 hypothetical protein [Spiroplasma poulsonii]PQM32122.1 hypothetical protein SMSRO_SF020220 [Spiroplasma poulsonii]PWF94768.1 hypothetical protein SMSE_01920 [Spiroplasma poulsonii]